MKRFIVSLLFLIILGGTAFFFGYMPLRLEPGEYGIVYTKTGGWNHPPIRAGEPRWMWEALLPTNLRFWALSSDSSRAVLNIEGLLPSGDVYARYAGGGESFAYYLRGSVAYTLSPESVPSLFAQIGTPEAGLEPEAGEVLTPVQKEIESQIAAMARETAEEMLFGEKEPFSASVFSERLEGRVAEALPGASLELILVDEYRFPDLDLYRQTRENYLIFLNRSHEIQMKSLETASSARAQQMSRIEILKEYGALLEEYPVLLDYFSKGGSDLSLIPLPGPAD